LKLPVVAVAVLNFNGKHHLKDCLDSLSQQLYRNCNVYVVDNGSTDGSVDFAREEFPWVRIIAFDRNYGFAEAYNRAIEMLQFDFVALLNNDVAVDSEWLEELVEEILKDESIAACGSKILLYSDRGRLNHAGAKFTPIGAGYDVGLYEKDSEEYDRGGYVGAVCGAAMIVRRNAFIRIGGFDRDFFAYFEDTDFCWRAWLYGFKIVYVPSSRVYHKLGGSWGSVYSGRRVYLGERNRLLTMFKNFEAARLLRGVILSVFFVSARLVGALRRSRVDNVSALLKAHLWILSKFRKVLVKRALVQAKKRVSNATLERLGFIASSKEAFREFRRFKGVK